MISRTGPSKLVSSALVVGVFPIHLLALWDEVRSRVMLLFNHLTLTENTTVANDHMLEFLALVSSDATKGVS